MQKVRVVVTFLRKFDVKSKDVNSNALPQGDLLKKLLVKILN